MQNLTRASTELFRRTPDETFTSLAALADHCRDQREGSAEHWEPPNRLWPKALDTSQLLLAQGEDRMLRMTDWSFGQLCRLSGVSKETVNRLTPETASRVFGETLPQGSKPLQVFTTGDQARSIHGASYTRLYNAELLEVVEDCAEGFEAPPQGLGGRTGLYCGEQDMFLFLIDPDGWTEIDGEAFAPGFFAWNSEVGRRSLGVQTFWYQRICQNHIVWDAVEVVEFSRKHTANVHRSLDELRHVIRSLVAKRDARRSSFARVIKQAMQTKLGDDAEEVQSVLTKSGIARTMAQQAIELVRPQGRYTVFAMVDALTRLASRIANAGDRTSVDQQVGKLLTLAV